MSRKRIFLSVIILLQAIVACNVIYAQYILVREFNIEGKTVAFYFDAMTDDDEFFLEDNRVDVELTVKNNDGINFNTTDTTYEVSLLNNEKFTLEVENENITNNNFNKTIIGNEIKSETIKITIVAKDDVTLNTTENITIKVISTYPYEKEFSFPITLIVDEIKPTIELSANETNWTNQDVTLTAIFKDNESGIVGYAWTNNEEEPTAWETVSQTTSQITKTNAVSSNMTKYFWAKDGMGNVNMASIIVDNIDKIDPSTPTIKIIDISITANRWQYTISVSGATDSQSQIKNYDYILGSSTTSSTESTKTITGTNDPNYTIKVLARDNAGNCSADSNEMVLNIERLYIRQLYQALRSNGGGSESEIDGWENHTTSVTAAQLAFGIFNSEESGILYTNIEKEEMLERLYNGILGRSADSSGLSTYITQMTSDNWFEVNSIIIPSLVNSTEAQNIYSARGLPTGTI